MNARIEPGEQAPPVGVANDDCGERDNDDFAAVERAVQPTLSSFLAAHLAPRRSQAPGVVHAADAAGLCAVIDEIAQAVKIIAARIGRGAISGQQAVHAAHARSNHTAPDTGAHDVLAVMYERGSEVAGMVSAGVESVRTTSAGRYVLFADPLDGTANAGSNDALGTVFSLRLAGAASAAGGCAITGTKQLAAGYALFGPLTMMVITIGRGTHGFTLCRERDEFVLTHQALRIPEQGAVLAINGGNERFWEPPVQRYMRECRDGSGGVRQRDFDTRWSASLAADTHRTLMSGGLCLFPRESRRTPRAARAPLLYQAQSLAWLVEQAGGLASTGRARILDVQGDMQASTPMFFGTQREVERIERYHREHERGEDAPFTSPLFNERSLFRPEARV
ncbi:class 1 fructose-bisphosphatase [Paraburkholderia diazotrophica]|uniref:Fructose-1,6-bisphosphatase class 1 n=1 Tax=Paraburkholderia diazotrophica TaxID=667676 RepID=A0A1H6YNF7_9BURK|nr:class 1 fructose-bisphosphatase [Paraburkholderia diazotrophica]SEJ38790.1 fructose-1,6-bisphosphatase I [Paraburkholderia diazotrophica]